MMKIYRSVWLYVIVLMTASFAVGCKKDFLDVRPSKALLVPSRPEDFRALLDNNFIFGNSPGLGVLSDGDLYATETAYTGYLIDEERRAYTWAADLFGTTSEEEWNLPYRAVFYANVVLEGLAALQQDKDAADLRTMRGEALFQRGFSFYHLAQAFAQPYVAGSSASVPGIPLRLTASVTDKAGRGTLEETYTQILRDLREARSLLPVNTAYKSRPTVAAAYAMLSKTYLAMGDYSRAGLYADSCLQLRPELLDYNTLNAASTRPFPRVLPNANPEVIFYAVTVNYDYTGNNSQTLVVPELYDSYTADDLRKSLFYRSLAGGFKFKGNYSGILYLFSGLATDEMYLTRAECYARSGNTAAAMADLNKLLAKRWRTGAFVPLTAGNADEALAVILAERRKELVMRGTRWADLRRLNPDPRFAVTLSRSIAGNNYQLMPGDKRYTFPIPDDEVKLNGLQQNER